MTRCRDVGLAFLEWWNLTLQSDEWVRDLRRMLSLTIVEVARVRRTRMVEGRPCKVRAFKQESHQHSSLIAQRRICYCLTCSYPCDTDQHTSTTAHPTATQNTLLNASSCGDGSSIRPSSPSTPHSSSHGESPSRTPSRINAPHLRASSRVT